MRVTSISLTRTLQVDAYNWVKCGLQADMEENDTPEQSIKELEKVVDGYFDEKIKSITPPKPPLIPKKPTDKLSIGLTEDEALISSINKCTILDKPDGLLSFETLASKSPSVKAAYDLRLTQIKKGLVV